jgi:hypothetical protein
MSGAVGSMGAFEVRRHAMAIVVGFGIHREQVTFDALDDVTGEVRRGRIAPADRIAMRRFLGSLPAGQIDVALEGTTGWRFIVEELVAAGATAHLAEPAETANLRGRKARAKTDRADARHLRELLQQGRLPEAWAPPEEILELRQRVRLRKTLVDERTAWQQRIHALLFHHGIQRPRVLLTREGRDVLAKLALSASAREALAVALAMIDACDAQLAPLDCELRRYAQRQAGCVTLMKMFGVGCVDEHSDPGRARRRATLLVLAPRGSLRRSRHHRLLVRRSSLARTSLAARLERVALGRLRGGADRSSLRLARPRLLPEPRRTTRKESRQARARAQAPTPRAPHPPRARRRRALPRNLTPFRAQLPSLS